LLLYVQYKRNIERENQFKQMSSSSSRSSSSSSSASQSSRSRCTSDREVKLEALKRRIVWAACTNLARSSSIELAQGGGGGGAVGGGKKRGVGEDVQRERQMLDELDKLILRVKEARSEHQKFEEMVVGTNEQQQEATTFVCDKCGNRDTDNFFTDPRTGDTICRGPLGDNNCGEVLKDHMVDRGAAHRNF